MGTDFVFYMFSFILFAGFTLCQTLSPAPSVENYLGRSTHTTTIIGDWLYLDGGEIAQLVDGEPAGYEGHWLYKINHTLSIPLSESWTSDSVTWKLTNKSAPVFLGAALWTYEDTWVNWGGKGSYAELTHSKIPWQFTADGEGGGDWAATSPSNQDVFLDIARTFGAAKAICKGRGISLGGWKGRATDYELNDISVSEWIPVPGLATYDFKTKMWSNESTADLNQYGTSILGAGTCLEELGEEGVFFAIGGDVASQGSWHEDGSGLVDLTIVSFWDVAGKKWYSQEIMGDTPAARDRHCLTSVRGPNGTYEIYLYGGYDPSDGTAFDDVWVLSIPAFTWFRADARDSTKRRDPSCQIVGNQLLSVGGISSFKTLTEPDLWSQGIAVLDLSSWTWTDQYQADTTYATPRMVQDWYQNHDPSSDVNWVNEEVKHLFLPDSVKPNGDEPPKGPPAPDPDAGEAMKNSIVEGVVGGAIGLAIIVAVVVLIKRRRSRRANQECRGMMATIFPSKAANSSELETHENPTEVTAQPTMLYPMPIAEQQGPPVELDYTPPPRCLYRY